MFPIRLRKLMSERKLTTRQKVEQELLHSVLTVEHARLDHSVNADLQKAGQAMNSSSEQTGLTSCCVDAKWARPTRQ